MTGRLVFFALLFSFVGLPQFAFAYCPVQVSGYRNLLDTLGVIAGWTVLCFGVLRIKLIYLAKLQPFLPAFFRPISYSLLGVAMIATPFIKADIFLDPSLFPAVLLGSELLIAIVVMATDKAKSYIVLMLLAWFVFVSGWLLADVGYSYYRDIQVVKCCPTGEEEAKAKADRVFKHCELPPPICVPCSQGNPIPGEKIQNIEYYHPKWRKQQ